MRVVGVAQLLVAAPFFLLGSSAYLAQHDRTLLVAQVCIGAAMVAVGATWFVNASLAEEGLWPLRLRQVLHPWALPPEYTAKFRMWAVCIGSAICLLAVAIALLGVNATG